MSHTAAPYADHGLHLDGEADAPSITTPIRLLGLDFDALSQAEALHLIAARLTGAPFAYVVTPNADHLVRLSRNRALSEVRRACPNQAKTLILPDTQPSPAVECRPRHRRDPPAGRHRNGALGRAVCNQGVGGSSCAGSKEAPCPRQWRKRQRICRQVKRRAEPEGSIPQARPRRDYGNQGKKLTRRSTSGQE
jgi:hypothetical protein